MKKEKLKTVDIKGKSYVTVSERIRYFNEAYPNGKIETEIISQTNGSVTMRSKVWPDAKIDRFFTGYAQEKEGGTFINKTSYIENCETSAVGRALGMMGIGVEASIASAEEVANAMLNQNSYDMPKTKKEVEETVENALNSPSEAHSEPIEEETEPTHVNEEKARAEQSHAESVADLYNEPWEDIYLLAESNGWTRENVRGFAKTLGYRPEQPILEQDIVSFQEIFSQDKKEYQKNKEELEKKNVNV